VILINAMDSNFADLVGQTPVDPVEGYLAQNATNIENRFEMLIERARQRLALSQAGTVPARLAAEWARASDLTAGLPHSSHEECPACADLGVLEGEQVLSADLQYEQISEDDFEVWFDLTVGSDRFSCPECRLVLDGYELLEQAGLPTTFGAVGDYGDYVEDEYGND
jgi:hypothetical protein